MATISEEKRSDAINSSPPSAVLLPDPPDPPDKTQSLDKDTSKPRPGLTKDSAIDPSMSTKPKHSNVKLPNVKNLTVLHVEDLPAQCDYETIMTTFKKYGTIKEIRMNFVEKEENWEAWVTFSKYEDALKASSEISTVQISLSAIRGALTDKAPRNMDIYVPYKWSQNQALETTVTRTPKPPMWLIATAKEVNYNYYKFSRYLQQKVGSIKSGDITRFGKFSVLIHAKSKTQAQMLCHMNLSNYDMIKEIRPHQNFSYGRGVIFDRDLYEFTENEILDMSPITVWKVKKTSVPNMIILTFEDTNVPAYVNFENERVRVRPFHPRPIQCFNCLKFGHPSKVCKNAKMCENCSAPDHGSCSRAIKCINCNLDHKFNDKTCEAYKYEQSALNKANMEHISIGYAKHLLGKAKSYAKALNPLPLTTTGGLVGALSVAESVSTPVVVAQSSGSGAPTPVDIAQPSGSGAQPGKARALDSKHGRVISTPSPSSLEALHPTVVGEESIPLARTSDPSSVIREQTYTSQSSQAESLPDLMEYQTGKRGRPTSVSPPPIKGAITANRFEALASHRSKSPPSKKLVGRTEVEIHSPRTDSKKKDKKERGSHAKPSISRPDMTSSNKSHKTNEQRKTKHK